MYISAKFKIRSYLSVSVVLISDTLDSLVVFTLRKTRQTRDPKRLIKTKFQLSLALTSFL